MAINTDLVPQVELENFLRRYGEGKRRQNMEPIYREMLILAEQLAEPQTFWEELALAEVAEIDSWLPEDAAKVVFALCTLGPAIEARIDSLFPEAPHKAVVLDEISAAQVSHLALLLHREIRRTIARQGLKAGAPYRPGVGSWPLSVQRTVFAKLPAERIGVVINEHMLMSPFKSTSLVIPVLDRRKQ